jgi:hypothetical protein
MASHIAQPPNAVGHTSFTQPGVATSIATPPAGTVGPIIPPPDPPEPPYATYVLQGVGAPVAAAPDGTIYVDTTGLTADTVLYVMIAAVWTPMLGAT